MNSLASNYIKDYFAYNVQYILRVSMQQLMAIELHCTLLVCPFPVVDSKILTLKPVM